MQKERNVLNTIWFNFRWESNGMVNILDNLKISSFHMFRWSNSIIKKTDFISTKSSLMKHSVIYISHMNAGKKSSVYMTNVNHVVSPRCRLGRNKILFSDDSVWSAKRQNKRFPHCLIYLPYNWMCIWNHRRIPYDAIYIRIWSHIPVIYKSMCIRISFERTFFALQQHGWC